jgi:hypothetical protein
MGQYFDNIEAFEGFFVYFFYMHIKTQRAIKSYAEKNRVFGARNVFIKEIEIEVEVWQFFSLLILILFYLTVYSINSLYSHAYISFFLSYRSLIDREKMCEL